MRNAINALLLSSLCAAAGRAQVAQVFSPEDAIQGVSAAAQAAVVRQPKLDCDYVLRWGHDGAQMGTADLISFFPGDGDAMAAGTVAASEGKKLSVQASIADGGRLSVEFKWRRASDGAVLGCDRESYAPKTIDGFAFAVKFESSEPAAILAKNPQTPTGTLPISLVQVKCVVRAPH